jgi:hypothetical protein
MLPAPLWNRERLPDQLKAGVALNGRDALASVPPIKELQPGKDSNAA